MKNFLLLVFKVAIVLTLLTAAGFGIYKGVEIIRQKMEYEARLATPKTWDKLTLHSLEKAEASLVTKWQDGFISYQFELKGYPAIFTQTSELKCSSTPKFNLTFLDKNGFKIFDQEIIFSDTKQLVDGSGKPIGLSAKGGTYKPAGVYGRAASWDVVWVP